MMKQVKTSKSPKNSIGHGDSHVSHSSMGMGDYYGTGIRAKMGTMRSGMGMEKVSKKEMSKPPTSLA